MNTSPESVVQRQLDAYNARDIEAFIAQFADDAEVFELGTPAPGLSGKEAIRARYTELFARSPQLSSKLVNRIAFARAVMDHERITGRFGAADVYEMVAIYEVEGGLIRRLHAVRPT